MTTSEETTTAYVLPELAIPVPDPDGLDGPYWDAVRESRLVVQRCASCDAWQWGPEWACYECGAANPGWEEVPTGPGGTYEGEIYSWERVWHPAAPQLKDAVPYVILMVGLPTAGDVRMVGNLVGDQQAPIEIGRPVRAVFEHHDRFTLVQWELT